MRPQLSWHPKGTVITRIGQAKSTHTARTPGISSQAVEVCFDEGCTLTTAPTRAGMLLMKKNPTELAAVFIAGAVALAVILLVTSLVYN